MNDYTFKFKEGYTLLEIIVTVVIIGILASLAIPRLTFTLEKTKATDGIQLLSVILKAQKLYYLENNKYADDINDLEIDLSTGGAQSAYFRAPEIFNNEDALAELTRNQDPVYTLSINKEGEISCNSDSQSICQRLGYRGGR